MQRVLTFFLISGAVFAAGKPGAILDLKSLKGAATAAAQWRYRDVRIIEIDSKGPGLDLKPSGAPLKTNDISPRPGSTEFDGPGWKSIPADSLEARRSNGRVSFAWYRLNVTIPERVGKFETRGSTVVFEIVIDDYAEIWVNGKLPLILGQTGGQVVTGFNAPNRIILTREAQPGQKFDLAILGINGPVSVSPQNFIWIRSATLDFYRAPLRGEERPNVGSVTRLDPAIDEIIPKDAKLEKIAGGFQFTEGPVWHPDGYLLFSDPNDNTIYRWSEDSGVSVFRVKSGYTGEDIGEFGQPGSNGLTLDSEGRLVIAEHGRHRISRLEKNGVITVLADRFQGKRLNSPNDLVFRSDGALYFSDPPFGLPKFHDDPRRELPFEGVFVIKNGELRLAAKDVTGPNGLAFSPDERYLYLTNWDEKKKVILRYEALPDGSLANGRVFFDMGQAPGTEALDGIKVDERGNLFVSGPGGVWVISPEGRRLGMIHGPELPANFAWGGAGGRTLYMTARTGVYRMRMNIPGIRPPLAARTGPASSEGR